MSNLSVHENIVILPCLQTANASESFHWNI